VAFSALARIIVWSYYMFLARCPWCCRLAGATLIAPVVNYWWPGFPANLSTEAYYLQLPQDQWTLRVAHHAPWLTYWWNTQKWFPASAVAARKPEVFSRQDLEVLLSMVTDGRMNMVLRFLSLFPHYKEMNHKSSLS
jgi:hypothetical protein